MILGAGWRVRPVVELVELGTDIDLSEVTDEETYEVASESM
jgi:hypothetical protein